MKKPINEIAKLKRLAGLITESEYQEEVANVEEISDAAKDIMGDLEGGAFERMNSLVNRNHILSLLAAAEGIMGDLEADGFEVEDIRAYINQIIVNDI